METQVFEDRVDVLDPQIGIVDEETNREQPVLFVFELLSKLRCGNRTGQGVITSQPTHLAPANRLVDGAMIRSLREDSAPSVWSKQSGLPGLESHSPAPDAGTISDGARLASALRTRRRSCMPALAAGRTGAWRTSDAPGTGTGATAIRPPVPRPRRRAASFAGACNRQQPGRKHSRSQPTATAADGCAPSIRVCCWTCCSRRWNAEASRPAASSATCRARSICHLDRQRRFLELPNMRISLSGGACRDQRRAWNPRPHYRGEFSSVLALQPKYGAGAWRHRSSWRFRGSVCSQDRPQPDRFATW